ncbi:MAG: alanine racemase [Flavobacteriaceae bacterium]|nr:alanine racemase [Flavobacteriaceae bacterium]
MSIDFHSCKIEISKAAFKHNIEFLRNTLNDGVKISSVVKGNAYGHSINLFVPLAEENGIDHFSVFSADEAYKVQKASTQNSQIMIMGSVENEQLEWAIEHDISCYVFDLQRLKQAVSFAKKTNKKAKIHIEVETGMHRTGFDVNEWQGVAEIIKANHNILIFEGLCTHYAGAEEIANYYRIKQQQQNFRRAKRYFKDFGLEPQLIHTACSAATLRYPQTQDDMVRLGIVQYGFFPTKEVLIHFLEKTKMKEDPLRRLLSWKSKVMDVKQVKIGDFIGYGTSFMAGTDMKIATIPVGYSHGFSRSLSNQGRVLINGQRVPVIGVVNMNMITVDVTHLDTVEKGNEVVLIGNQGDLEIGVSSFSEYSNQINYEMLTRLRADIPRILVD